MSTKAQGDERLDFIDAMRGIAVLCMIWMHTGDGWLQPALRQGQGWDLVRAVGGLAAPLFLLLTGVSLGLASVRAGAASNGRTEVARGLRILLLGYLLRVQMWMLDGAGYEHLAHWSAALPLAGGYLAGYVGVGRWAQGRPAGSMLALASFGVAAGLWLVSQWIPSRLVGVLRVDVLQTIGVSLVLLGVLGPVLRYRTGALLALAALTTALTPWVRSWVPGPLPEPLAGYLGYWSPGPGLTPVGMFPLFPWFAYPCVGLVLGRHWGRLGPTRAVESALTLCASGAMLALATCELFPPVHALLHQHPELLQPARVAYRIGVCLMIGGLAVGLSRPGLIGAAAIASLGRASLFVYWVHLEFAFGMLGRPLVRQLDLAGWAIAWALLCALMTALAWLWSRLRPMLPRASLQPAPSPAQAAGKAVA